MALDFETREKFDELNEKIDAMDAKIDAMNTTITSIQTTGDDTKSLIASQMASVKASLANLRRPRA